MSVTMGCVIVTYNSANHIRDCLQSLAIAEHITLKIVVIDNASNDETVRVIQGWSTQNDLELSLIQAPHNLGFAAGVNLGLIELMDDPLLDRFWILNPDCTVPPHTPAALARATLPFSLLGCRITYDQPGAKIQIDGGQINTWTGATKNINIGLDPSKTPTPNATSLDFVSGASMVASRDFLKHAGLMPEQYFLYYEEVDWAQKRGPLPLAICNGATVYHSAGASIGSPTLTRGPSRVSAYFKHRARMMYMATHHPLRLPIAYLFGWVKVFQHAVRRQYTPIPAVLRALHGLPFGNGIDSVVNTRPQEVTKSRICRTNPS